MMATNQMMMDVMKIVSQRVVIIVLEDHQPTKTGVMKYVVMEQTNSNTLAMTATMTQMTAVTTIAKQKKDGDASAVLGPHPTFAKKSWVMEFEWEVKNVTTEMV